MAARRPTNNPHRDGPKPRENNAGKGGLIAGLFIGLVIGLIVAAGLAWYFNNRTPAFKSAEDAALPRSKTEKPASAASRPEAKPTPSESSPPTVSKTETAPEVAPKKPLPAATEDAAPSTAKPRVDYTFYGILPGDKPAKQALPKPQPAQSKDIWWLQVAALKNPADADKLKARLTLLGLQVAMQKVDAAGSPLYRIRTGPYKREDDAFGDLDILSANNFEPRLFKEPNPLPAPPNHKEKP